MPKLLPAPDDLESDDLVDLAQGNLSVVAQRLQVDKDRLEQMLISGRASNDVIHGAIAEFDELIRLRMRLMAADALAAMDMAMRGGYEGKKANAAVKAASELLDRGGFPKLSRNGAGPNGAGPKHSLPTLDELLEGKNPGDALAIMEQHRQLLCDIEALRRGAKEIIDAKPVRVESPQTAES